LKNWTCFPKNPLVGRQYVRILVEMIRAPDAIAISVLRTVFLALAFREMLSDSCRAGNGRQTLIVEADYSSASGESCRARRFKCGEWKVIGQKVLGKY
jgi:hypothetical protein